MVASFIISSERSVSLCRCLESWLTPVGVNTQSYTVWGNTKCWESALSARFEPVLSPTRINHGLRLLTEADEPTSIRHEEKINSPSSEAGGAERAGL